MAVSQGNIVEGRLPVAGVYRLAYLSWPNGSAIVFQSGVRSRTSSSWVG